MKIKVGFNIIDGLVKSIGITFLFLLLPIFLQTVPSGVLDGALMVSWTGQLPFFVCSVTVFVLSFIIFGLEIKEEI